MKYWDEMQSKWGFEDGGCVPAGAEVYREVYIRAVNLMAKKLGSAMECYHTTVLDSTTGASSGSERLVTWKPMSMRTRTNCWSRQSPSAGVNLRRISTGLLTALCSRSKAGRMRSNGWSADTPERNPMTKLEEAYEQAKAAHRAAQRALFVADGQKLPAADLMRLQRALGEAQEARRRAFAAFMDEIQEVK